MSSDELLSDDNDNKDEVEGENQDDFTIKELSSSNPIVEDKEDPLNKISSKRLDHENALYNLSQAEFCSLVGLCSHIEAERMKVEKAELKGVKRLRRSTRKRYYEYY